MTNAESATTQDFERARSHPLALGVAVEWLVSAEQHQDVAAFLEFALASLRTAAKCEFAAVARSEKGTWNTMATTGAARPLPAELCAEVLDNDAARADGHWCAAPLLVRAEPRELLVAWSGTSLAVLAFDAVAALLGITLAAVRERHRQRYRIAQLEAVLEIAAQWSQTLDLNQLLQQMAETSTKLLNAERASIFLWDRPLKTLIGRPALGVKGGELRIPDDQGVVGRVIHSGDTARVDGNEAAAPINRTIDKKLGYHTRTLLCVPLRGKSGELFGAFEMLNKRGGNFTDDDEVALVELAHHAAIALENTQQFEQILRSRDQLADQAAQSVQLIGECPAIDKLRNTLRRVAETDLAVLVLGENGTGKEVVSQAIHYGSPRHKQPFVAVNCAAITETLLESELFGHEKGAFTDARETRPGKFELASGGTLLLDEIGDLSLGGQSKLLRVLEDKVVTRVGGSQPLHADVRVIAATNQNLAELVKAKRFREDLFFRLNVVTLELPPLRDRGDDVTLLAEHFLREFSRKARRKPPQLTAAARKRLLAHAWPGNVRELRNLMERLAYLCQNDKIDADELAFLYQPDSKAGELCSQDLPLAEATRQFQIDYIQHHIEAARGRMTAAAERLGLHRTNLYRKMKLLGMPTSESE